MKFDEHTPLKPSGPPGSRAVVIGGGMAGLSTARVLVRYFDAVYLFDRDRLPEEPAIRSGIPQALHAHTLLPYGQTVLEKLFPGLVERLLADGAQAVIDDTETAFFAQGQRARSSMGSTRPVISCSRPMLENAIYHEITRFPQVKIIQGMEVTGLMVDEHCDHVSGITFRSRVAPGEEPQPFRADLVVDASGRSSKTPQWLAHLGYPAPEEWRIDALSGYASRIYQEPQDYRRDWKKLVINPDPPDGSRGGVILPLEGRRWHVTLIGIAGDYPPTEEAAFLDFARSLSSPALYEAIRAAEPVSKIAGFRKNENRVRRYDHLPRYVEGLLVLGDAAYTMNPVYALGMTAAFVSSQVLDQVMRKWDEGRGMQGLSAAFQMKLAAGLATLWQLAVRSDWRWPATEISDNTEALYLQAA